MTARFEIIDAKPWHCGVMARVLRDEHKKVVERAGASAHRLLRECFDQSPFRRAWLIDGELAALGGVMGTIVSPSGTVWLALSQKATRYPIAIIKEARRQLAEILSVRREIVTTIVFGDDAARRLAIFLNFHVSHDQFGGAAYSKAERQWLYKFVETCDERIVSVGDVRGVIMGYHS